MKRVTSSIRVQWDAQFWALSVLRKQSGLPPFEWRGLRPAFLTLLLWTGRRCAIPSDILGRAIWKRASF